MNFSTFIVKLIENPIQSSFQDNIRITEVSAIISTKFKKQKQKPPLIKLTAWGNLSDVLMNYYQKDDLLVVEGIISLRTNFKELKLSKKFVEVTLISFYPYDVGEVPLEYDNPQIDYLKKNFSQKPEKN